MEFLKFFAPKNNLHEPEKKWPKYKKYLEKNDEIKKIFFKKNIVPFLEIDKNGEIILIEISGFGMPNFATNAESAPQKFRNFPLQKIYFPEMESLLQNGTWNPTAHAEFLKNFIAKIRAENPEKKILLHTISNGFGVAEIFPGIGAPAVFECLYNNRETGKILKNIFALPTLVKTIIYNRISAFLHEISAGNFPLIYEFVPLAAEKKEIQKGNPAFNFLDNSAEETKKLLENLGIFENGIPPIKMWPSFLAVISSVSEKILREIANSPQPKIVVAGERDKISNFPGMKKLAEKIGAKFLPIKNAGHFISAEKMAEILTAEIYQFLFLTKN